jgi:glucuronoarabinoxylan endo-1,4-beta-xylanase
VPVTDGAAGADAFTGLDAMSPPGSDAAGGDGAGSDATVPCTAGTSPASGSAQVELCTVNQTMDGFGAADVYSGTPLSPAQVTLFFDPTNGIGLSLLRIGIQDDSDTGTVGLMGGAAYADAKAVNAFGVKVWAAPWSPPAKLKVSGQTDGVATDPSTNNILIATDYDAWATEMAAFPATFKTNTGIDLYAMSAQNEPDFDATTYSSCLYSAAQMVTFVNDLGPKLAALSPPVKLLAAEPDSWNNLWQGDGYGPAIVAGASSAVNIIATHDYGHDATGDLTSTRPGPPAGVTQHIWETEMSDETAPDLTITQGIQTAMWVYAAITTGHASAWHYWWLINANTDGEGLLQAGGSTAAADIPKRLYTLGNYSKFIRPGYVNVPVDGTIPANVFISAYKDPSSGKAVVVAINNNTGGNTSVPVFLSGGQAVTQMTPYVTSATETLTAETVVTVTNSSFTASLEPQSVTTFVSN